MSVANGCLPLLFLFNHGNDKVLEMNVTMKS